jgi:hypothetical protein
MRITRHALFGGVRSPSLDLYFYLYAFLRLLLGLGYGRIGSLTSYKSETKERTNHLYSKQ